MSHKKWFFIAIILVVLAITALLYIKNQTLASQISANEAKEKVEQLYTGKVLSTEEEENNFVLTLELSEREYEIVLDRYSGEILSMTKTKNSPTNDSNSTNDQGNGEEEPINNQTNEELPSQITEQEAITIALKQVPGTFEEIELEESNGDSYYLVEIEGKDQQEATIQVHSITGEILSVTWDD